ncbi:MAG: hypothetical protein Q7T05_00405 [Dehalococcoidia bacterium]|nr:hypothetical protein [Dehalococcoidia bacterium]
MTQKISFIVYGKIEPMARARVFVDKHTGKIRAINPAAYTDWKNTGLTVLPQSGILEALWT